MLWEGGSRIDQESVTSQPPLLSPPAAASPPASFKLWGKAKSARKWICKNRGFDD